MAVCVLLALVFGQIPETAEAQRETLHNAVRVLRPAGRLAAGCGGDQIDGVCRSRSGVMQCSDDPLSVNFDADCFSVDALVSPEPAAACTTEGERCEIHEAIDRMGVMYQSGVYDNRVILEVVLAYWDGKYWNLSDRWGAHGLDGYVVYAVARNALRYRDDMERHPTTVQVFERMLRDHAGRGLPTTVDNGERWFHGGERPWNTWSEDYMAFALGYAAADAWFASTWHDGEYFDDYFEAVAEAVDLAFGISDRSPQTLRFEFDADPAMPAGEQFVMLRNHNEYSPVYAMAIIARLWDVNTVYQAASLPVRYTCSNKPENLDALYRWMTLKIEVNPVGAGYVFRSGACERRDGVLSFCDDRPGDPERSPGHQREPGHFPLDHIMPQLCVTDNVESFGPSCEFVGPAGIEQQSFNYYFNCVFLEVDGDSVD